MSRYLGAESWRDAYQNLSHTPYRYRPLLAFRNETNGMHRTGKTANATSQAADANALFAHGTKVTGATHTCAQRVTTCVWSAAVTDLTMILTF